GAGIAPGVVLGPRSAPVRRRGRGGNRDEETMNQHADELLKRLENRTARVGVVGLGYVGLPLLVEFARAGFRATGIDLDERTVQAIDSGQSYIPDVRTEDVAALRSAGRLDATTDFAVVADLDTINICVPTPL